MAYDPCDCHGVRFRGRSSLAYPCLLHDGQQLRKRVRLCPDGAKQLRAGLGFEFIDLDGPAAGTREKAKKCCVCRADTTGDGSALVFVTTYLAGEDRQDFAGVVCPLHEADAARMLFLGP